MSRNKKRVNKKSERKLNRRELKQKVVNFMGGKCVKCGYNKCLAALTFHHRDPTEKDFTISDIFNMISWRRLKRELLKCQIVCANCHAEIHYLESNK